MEHRSLPSQVGGYQLIRTLGAGSAGKVKLGVEPTTREEYAVKIIHKYTFNLRPRTEANIYREIGVMMLLDHPNVLKLHDVVQSEHDIFVIMELARGGDLRTFVASRGHLDEETAIPLFRSIICGVEYLHSRSICHRDLKLENILLGDDVKIADFGFARWTDSALISSCGSPQYIAPEVVEATPTHPYDGKASDVWSCGVILYAMLTGKYPFDDPNVYRLLRRVRTGSFAIPAVDSRVQDLLARTLTVDPNARITIPEIKEHAGFWLDAPRVSLPTPPPLPIPDEPVDIRSLDSEFIGILKMLGYESQSKMEAELAAQGPTNAKRLKQMMDIAMTRRKSRPGTLVAG